MRIAEPVRELVRPYYLRWVFFRLYPHARPPQFAACWQYPHASMGRAPRPTHARPGVIFYPMNDWHTRLQRTQQLATALTGLGYRCLHLNPHLGRQFENVRGREHRIGILGEDLYELHVRLPREPVFHHRLLTAAESTEVSDAVAGALDTLRMSEPVQIVSFPLWFDAAAALRRALGLPILYDCHDLLAGFGNIAPALVSAEERQLRNADRALFSSENLRQRFVAGDASLAARSLLLRNAVDFERFGAEPVLPPDTPEAVYAGALERWFDTAAVRAAARANPSCRISLIGRVDAPHIHELGPEPNIRWMGEMPHTRLPALLGKARVGLIPFQVNSMTLATNPIKLYEYFSLGMPVVSSALPEVEQFGDLVYIAPDTAAFPRALRDALREDDPARRLRRREIARAESWSARASRLSEEFPRVRER